MIRFKKDQQTSLEPTSSSPLPSTLSSPSSSPPMTPPHYSSSDVSLLSPSLSPRDSRSPSPGLSPRESTKLPFPLSKDDKDDIKCYDHNGDLSISGDMFSDMFSEYSVEDLRSETPHRDDPLRSKCVNNLESNDISQLSFKHVQYMLDDNQKLSEEVSLLKTKINTLSGDYTDLVYKYQQLEKKFREKNKELIELEGKVSALTAQLRSESEAKNEAQAALALAESTIESLNRQMGEMAKSDSAVRLRDNYEAMLNKLQNQHESEIINLKSENEGLKNELDIKQTEIDKLKANREADSLSNVNDLKQRYGEILRETCNKVEYESILKKKDLEIESLKQEIAGIKSNTSNQSSAQSFSDCCKCLKKSLTQNESDYVRELKEEFEKCLVNLQTRRTQIVALQTQLSGVKKQNSELREKLKETEKKLGDTNKLLQNAHGPWLREVEAHYSVQFEKDLKEAIRVMDKTQREEMERSFNQRLEDYVNRLIEYLRSLSDLDCPEVELDHLNSVFAPLRKLWISINCNLEDRLIELDQKQQSMLEAKEDLEKALIISRSIEAPVQQSSLINMELEKIKEEGAQMKVKLEKYKRHYHRLIDKHEKEIEDLKNQYVKIVAEREKDYRRREELLIEEFKDNPLAMCRKLSKNINPP